MPIYEYECSKCGEFEVTQRITDGPLDRCPTCRRKVKKLISNSSFRLKGSGWYVTDYGRKDGRAGTEASEAKGNGKPGTADTLATKDDKKEVKKESKKDAGGARAA